MRLAADGFNLQNIETYAHHGIDLIVYSLPCVSLRSICILDETTLSEAKALCAKYSIELGINMMRFFVEDELDDLRKMMHLCVDRQVDVIYFSDMSVYMMAKEMNYENHLIYQPNTLITNSVDAQFYLNQNLYGVTCSREITLEEISAISSKCKGLVEVMAYGYANIMHSKRHLLTSYFSFTGLDDRSDKVLSLVEEQRDGIMPVFQDECGTHVFSDFILALFKEACALEEAGVSQLKIEGILLDSQTVVQVADDFRKVLNHEEKGTDMFEKYQSMNKSISDGFMYQKTSKVKEVL